MNRKWSFLVFKKSKVFMYLFKTRKVCNVIYWKCFYKAFWRTDMANCSDFSEAATWGVYLKKMLLKISQNSQENTCVGVSISINSHASGLQLYQKRGSDIGAFLCIQWIFKNTFFQNTSEQLLLSFTHENKASENDFSNRCGFT